MATFFGIPLPGLSGFRDPTQQQIAQLQQGMTPADPYADSGWQPFNPNTARWNAGAQALAGLGAGLLSGRNWSEGLSRGLMAAQQGANDASANARRDYYVDQQGRYMQRKMQQEDRANARQDAQQAGVDKLIGTLPADQQPWARVAPEAFVKARVDQMFPAAEKPTSDIQNWQFYKQQGGNLPFNDWMLQSKKAGAPSTNVTVGGAQIMNNPLPLDKQNTTKQQETVLDTQNQLDSLNYIKSLYSPDYLTYRGGAEAFAANVLNKMDPNQRSQFASRRANFISQTQQYFNAYRKWATGAAASEKEMNWLQESVPSADDSPQEFEAKLQTTQQRVKKVNIRSQMALRSGIQPGADPRWQQFAAEHPLDGIPSANERGAQLEQLGYPKEQVVQILRQEGY